MMRALPRIAGVHGERSGIADFMRVERIQNGYLLRYLWCTISEPKKATVPGGYGEEGPEMTFVTIKDTTLFCADEEALVEGTRKALKAYAKIRESKKVKGGLLTLDYEW